MSSSYTSRAPVTQHTSLILHTCSALHEDGRSSSGGIACQAITAVYPGSTTVLPVQENISPPTSNITIVNRYRQSELTCNTSNTFVRHIYLPSQTSNAPSVRSLVVDK